MENTTVKDVFIKSKDYSVSGEKFELLYNQEYDLLETYPKPIQEKLPEYYKSEDYISHTDGKRNLFERLYQGVKNYMLNKKVNLINELKYEKGNLLDIGAGTGDFLDRAKNSGWRTYGVEPNKKARTIAKHKNIELNDDLTNVMDIKYDIITLWHVLEHVTDVHKSLSQIKSLLKPNGILIIAVPNYKSFDANHYKEFWAGYDVPRHLWHFSKNSIKVLGREFGLQVLKTKPMFFDSFYVSLLSEKYKTGKMNFFSGFYTGLVSNIKAIRSKEYSSHIYILKNR